MRRKKSLRRPIRRGGGPNSQQTGTPPKSHQLVMEEGRLASLQPIMIDALQMSGDIYGKNVPPNIL